MDTAFFGTKHEDDYYKLCSKIESNDNPRAKNPRSTASGRFQFIRSTWVGLGYDWKDVFNDALQWQAIKKLTRQNGEFLEANGCAINFATLYGSHFLGASGFLKIMRANRSQPITDVTSAAQRKANPTILKGTVGDFCEWLRKKTGDDVSKRYTSGGFVSGPGVVVPPDEPKKEAGLTGALVIVIVGLLYAAYMAWQNGVFG